MKKLGIISAKKSVNFWQRIKKPVFVIAPMANVTDYAFRTMFAKYGKPDVMWTEFVSADGLCSDGKKKLLHDLEFSAKERPIVAQLFTGHPEKMREAVKLVKKLGFDGVDINMGCPDRSVEKQGGGASMMKNPGVALEILRAAREGWGGAKSDADFYKIPVSVKTRIGYNKEEIDTWIRLLLEQNLPTLTVHLRTRKEMSEVAAHWELMPQIIVLRDQIQKDIPVKERTIIIGNGDVGTMEEARDKVEKYGCDGVMIGRGIFGKPWFFDDKNFAKIDHSPELPLKIMLEHAKLYDKLYCGKKHIKNFAVMKKHFKAYANGFDGAKELRVKLMETNTYKEVKNVVDDFLKNNVLK